MQNTVTVVKECPLKSKQGNIYGAYIEIVVKTFVLVQRVRISNELSKGTNKPCSKQTKKNFLKKISPFYTHKSCMTLVLCISIVCFLKSYISNSIH